MLCTKGAEDGKGVPGEAAQRHPRSAASTGTAGPPAVHPWHLSGSGDEQGVSARSGRGARCCPHSAVIETPEDLLPPPPQPPAPQPRCVTPFSSAVLSKKSTYGWVLKQTDPPRPDPDPADECLGGAGCRRGLGDPAACRGGLRRICLTVEKSQPFYIMIAGPQTLPLVLKHCRTPLGSC